MEPILIVENVSKKFSKKSLSHRVNGIRDLITEMFGRSKLFEINKDEFLAVNDLSFELFPGETFALIGRNGCGKTTTLKMLNGTLKPNSGRITINGRVQALIALGAGFDPKLSGRENIFNSAAVLGLSNNETKKIIDEIIDFAELEDFIDSPVQTYSSGMYARLGFSVSVHLKPDIMLIDEILSVGDYAFQNKCFTKMQELKKQGVTIVLVSHAHTRVVQFCEKALWLNQGKIINIGPAKEVVNCYLEYLDEVEARKIKFREHKINIQNNNEKVKQTVPSSIYGPIYNTFDKIDNLKVCFYVNGKEINTLRVHDELIIRYSFDIINKVSELNVSLNIYRKEDGLHYNTISTLNGDVIRHINSGNVSCEVTIPDFNLNSGNYVFVMPIHSGHSYLYRDVVKEFIVTGAGRMTWGLIDFKYTYEVF